MKKIIILLVAAFILLSAGAVMASETKEDAIKVINAVETYFKAHGKAATIAELNKPAEQGAFSAFAPLYAFAYDLNYNMIAHYKTKLIGQNFEKVPDVKGKMFRKDIVDIAKASGSGWVDYWYKDPETDKLSLKTTYVKLLGDMVVACGVYK